MATNTFIIKKKKRKKRPKCKFKTTRVQHGREIYNYVPMQSVPITTNVVSSNSAHGKVYLIQHYVIKFVSVL